MTLRFPILLRFLQVIGTLTFVGYFLTRILILNEDSVDWKEPSRWASKIGKPSDRSKALRRLKSSIECDPYKERGHLYTSDNLFESRYIIYNDPRPAKNRANVKRKSFEDDSPGVDWIVPSFSKLINEKRFDELEFMRNRTVLVIGDSIDRNLVIHFGRRALQGTKGTHSMFIAPDSSKIPPIKLDEHKIGLAHSPELNFTMFNWFLMGLCVQEEVPFFHPREDLPQNFESRLETYFLPIMRQSLLPRPDLIVFSTSFWDLQYLSRARASNHRLENFRDLRIENGPNNTITQDRGDGNPISLTDLAYHRDRLRKFIRYIDSAFKDLDRSLGFDRKDSKPIEIMYRSIQLGNAKPSNAFARERVVQLEESNRMVVEEFGIPIIEWGKMSTGLEYQLDDATIHFGIGSVQYIFGDMVLFYLKRKFLGMKDEWPLCDWLRNRKISQPNKPFLIK